MAVPCLHSEGCCQEKEQQEIFVRFLTESVLFQIYRHALTVPVNKVDITERLFKSVWAAVENSELVLPPEPCKKLSKKIFRDLCGMWSGAHHLLYLLKLKDSIVDSTVASIFKFHLTKPQKPPNAVQGLLSSFGKTMSELFRGSTKSQSPWSRM